MEAGGDVIDYAQYFYRSYHEHFFLLKTQWEFVGLSAPAFTWVASAGIIACFIMIYLRQWRESRIRQRAFSIADERLKYLQTGKPGIKQRYFTPTLCSGFLFLAIFIRLEITFGPQTVYPRNLCTMG